MKPMRKLQRYFVPYTDESSFFLALRKAVSIEIEEYDFCQNIKRKVWPMLDQTSFFIIEDSYTETEWKDMIAEHYIHTKYETHPSVVRVHLFNSEHEIANAYLGCFTLRKINNADIVLSFIYPNWNVLSLEECNFSDSYIITAKKLIHIFAEEIEIETTPYFVQDGMVTSCAHASIIMMTHYLNLRFGYKKICIKDVNQSYLSREKMFPTKGLLPEQVMEVLTNNGINILEWQLGKEFPVEEEKNAIKGRVKAYLRSGIPIMLGMAGHGVLIVGFKDHEDEFLFLDDSGALIHDINKEKYKGKEQTYDNFISSCGWDYIFDYIRNKPSDLVQFLIPVHERIYSDYEDVANRCLILTQNIDFTKSKEDKKTYAVTNERFFLMDNAKCKKFVNENILDRQVSGELLDDFICSEQSHYLWCYEFEFAEQVYIIFINTTYNVTSIDNDIYVNKDCEPFHIAKHFETMHKVKTIDNIDIPLFEKRRDRGYVGKKRNPKKLGTIKAKSLFTNSGGELMEVNTDSNQKKENEQLGTKELAEEGDEK